MYEPIYISSADAPAFDERFIGYGMTRNTQVCKMSNNYCLLFQSTYFFKHSVAHFLKVNCDEILCAHYTW